MTVSSWQRRIERAYQLADRFSFASEILRFYGEIASFQEELHSRLEAVASNISSNGFAPPELSLIREMFGPFLSVVGRFGPASLVPVARDIQSASLEFQSNLLDASWSTMEYPAADPAVLLALAFLQPYAEFLRCRLDLKPDGVTHSLCTFCNRKAGLGILRQQGDGARRSLMCGFCLAEWEFRRIICPGCGEEDHSKLPVYSATDFDYIRVECCDTCKTYIKSVDLSKNGLAVPFVDEIAAAPLDLWARQHGYSKLQVNLLGL